MFIRKNHDFDSEGMQKLALRGLPLVQFGQASCSINGIPAYYLHIFDVQVRSGFLSGSQLVIVFNKGACLIFEGPRLPGSSKTLFLQQAETMAKMFRHYLLEFWKERLQTRIQKDGYISIGPIYYEKRRLTVEGIFASDLNSPDLKVEAAGSYLRIARRASASSSEVVVDEYPVGSVAAAFVWFIGQELSRKTAFAEDLSAAEKAAHYGIALFVLIATGWLGREAMPRVLAFLKARGIRYENLGINQESINYQALSLDLRLLRNSFNAIASYCTTGERDRQMRLPELIFDLIDASADGNNIGEVAVHIIYEIAVFQRRSMGYVRKLLRDKLGADHVVVPQPGWASQWNKILEEKERQRQARAAANEGFTPFDDGPATKKARDGAGGNSVKETRQWFFSQKALEGFAFFGFAGPPSEKEFRTAFNRLMKLHHPDRIQATGTAEEIKTSTAMVQSISARRDDLLRELEPYWRENK